MASFFQNTKRNALPPANCVTPVTAAPKLQWADLEASYDFASSRTEEPKNRRTEEPKNRRTAAV
jgi:hypothetical protein